jgi:putative ABC transport system permease protein
MQYFQQLVTRVQSIPGVSIAGITTVLPLGNVQINTRIFLRDKPDEQIRPAYRAVSPDYFRAMGIPVLRGRTFTDEDRQGSPAVVVVSDAFARKYWPGQDAVGKQITLARPSANDWRTVIGVVGGVRSMRLTQEPEPELYTGYQQTLMAVQVSTLAIRTAGDPAEIAPAVRSVIREINPNQPVTEVRTMSQVIWEARAQPRVYTILLAVFAGLALLLAAAGISSVISSWARCGAPSSR